MFELNNWFSNEPRTFEYEFALEMKFLLDNRVATTITREQQDCNGKYSNITTRAAVEI